jgi:hypothetical protein
VGLVGSEIVSCLNFAVYVMAFRNGFSNQLVSYQSAGPGLETDVKISEAMLVALTAAVGAVAGAIAGAYISGSAAEKVAIAQKNAQQAQIQSAAMLKLLELRAASMSQLFIAEARLRAAPVTTVPSEAAALAQAAGNCASVITGRARELCLRIQSIATDVALVPEMGPVLLSRNFELMARQMSQLKYVYDDLLNAQIEAATGHVYTEPASNSRTTADK